MRERLETDSARTRCGIRIIGDHIQAADFERIHADFSGRQIDQPFGHRARDGMPHTPVLTSRRLVLKHYVQMRTIILVLIRAPNQVHDLIALDRTGSWKHRIRADSGQIIDLKGEYFAIPIDRRARLDPMVAGMDVTREGLQTVSDKFHRATAQDRQRNRRKIIRIGVDLDAE